MLVCRTRGNDIRTRSIIAELIAAGADPNADDFSLDNDGDSDGAGNETRLQLEKGTGRALVELSHRPRPLRTLCAYVVRKCLAAAEPNGVIKNTDRLALPSTIKLLLKLERFDDLPIV